MSAAVPRLTNLERETNQKTQTAATDSSTVPDARSAVQVANAWPVDASSINEHGMTPLMQAAFEGSAGTVRALLDRGAELEAKRPDGFNALSLAAFFGHLQVVWILLEHGADLAPTGRAGTLPETWAEVRGFTEISDMIREARRQKHEAELRLRTSAIDEAARFPRAADPMEPQVLTNSMRAAEVEEEASSQAPELNIEQVAEESPARKVEAAATIIEPAQPVLTQETPAPPVKTEERFAQPLLTQETPAPAVKTQERFAQPVLTQETSAPPVKTQDRFAQPEQTQERPAPEEPTRALQFLPEIEDPPPLAVPQFNPVSDFISRIASNRRIPFALTLVMLMILGGIATLLIQQIRVMRAKQGTEVVTNTPNTVESSNPVNDSGTSGPAQKVETQSASTTESTVVPSASGTEQAVTESKTVELPAPVQTSDLSRGEAAKESYAERVDTRLSTSAQPGVGSAIENKPEFTPTSPITQFRAPFRKQRNASKATQFKQSVVEETPKPAPLTVEPTTRNRSAVSTPERSDTQVQASQPPPLSVTSGKPKSKVIQWP